LVTIIIPFYDELNFLEEAISSVLDQHLESYEILVVCNQATIPSGTANSTSVYTHPAVRWLNESQRGSAFARNKGLAEAKGEWIQFLDVDDLLLTNKIKTQLKYHQADMIVSPHVYGFLSGKKVPSAWAPEDFWAALLSSQLGSTSSMLWRKSALEKVGGWNTEYYSNQEYELMFRMLKAGFQIQGCADNLTLVRERISGSITKNTKHKPTIGIVLREEIWNYLVEQNMTTPERYLAFQKYVFKNLRALYIIDPNQAKKIHSQYFSGTSFLPIVRGVRLYTGVYKLLGFNLTERMMGVYRYIRKHFITSLPTNT